MTTDSVPKTAVQERNGWTVGGMAKGAGMLAPSMAVLTTDAVVPADVLQPALEQATSVGLERVDPLGCLSTNDTTTGMASGVSVVTPGVEKVSEALTAACTDLTVRCWRTRSGDPEDPDHRPQRRQRRGRAGGRRACAPSSVLETAPFGNDANWVRAPRAAPPTPPFESDQVDVSINGVMSCRRGAIGDASEAPDLTNPVVAIDVDPTLGTEQATIWTDELSLPYVPETSTC